MLFRSSGAGESGDVEKEKLLDHMLLSGLLKSLPESEQLLLKMRYFEERTQNEVAARLGISQVQVSRLEKKILLGMRSRAVH